MTERKACPQCGCAIIKDWCTRCTPKITIVSADRPENDDRETWRQVVAKYLAAGPRNRDRAAMYLDNDFVECDSCATKPGSPSLCAGCLANRDTVSRLREMLDGKA